MARGRFVARPDFQEMGRLKKSKVLGRLVLQVAKDDRGQIGEMLRTYERDAAKRAEAGEQPREIAFLWDVAYQKRSLSINNLTWALLTLTVNLMNEGMPDGKPKLTPQDQYNEDMGKVAPCQGIEVENSALPWLEEVGARVKYAVPIEGTTRVIAYVIKTSSKWNEQEAHVYVEFLFNRLAMMGVPLPDANAKLKSWWMDWMMVIEEHRIELHAEELSKDAYRELHPLCEGCMAFIGSGGGHLAHIKSVAAGGEEPEHAKGAEWLHLCPNCHLGVQHAKGWGALIGEHPHLKGKVDRALGVAATGKPAAGTAYVVKREHMVSGVRMIDEVEWTGVGVDGELPLQGGKSSDRFDDDPRNGG